MTIKEKKTFALHLFFCSFDYLISGFFLLKENILKKTLEASNLQIVILFSSTVGIFIFSSYINELVRRTHNKKRFVRIISVCFRLPMACLLFFPTSTTSTLLNYVYILTFLLLFMGKATILPVINQLIKANYTKKNFHHLYSWATTWGMIIMVIGTHFIGSWLNDNEYNYRYVYAIAAILGIVAVWAITYIPFIEIPQKVRYSLAKSVWISYIRSYKILKRNKPFFHFEMSFMLYGFAFMGCFALIKVYYEDVLHLSYATLSLNENISNVWKIIAMPVMGFFLGRIDPRKFQIFPFLSFALMYLFLIIAQYWQSNIVLADNYIFYWALFFAMTFHGLFFSMNILTWNIGSTFFCKPHQSSDYQSVHLVLTGIRGIIAPFIGYLFFMLFDYTFAFLAAIILLLLACIVLIYSTKKYPVITNR